MFQRSNSGSIQRVLIYRLGSLGDTVIALPCYRQIARIFPDAQRWLMTNMPISEKAPSAQEILKNSGLVHEYVGYPVGMRSAGQIFRLWKRIREYSPQVVVYLAAARGIRQAKRDAIFLRACGAKHLIGLPDTKDLQENRWFADRQVIEPEVERLARCLHELGPIDLQDPRNWDLGLTEQEIRKAEEVLSPLEAKPFLGIGMGTKMQAKDWGGENWGNALTRICSEFPQYAVALVGAAQEFEVCEQAARQSGCQYVNLCGKLTPRETGAVLAKARMYLGHDSGPMHLAAAMQTSCVGVFAAIRRPIMWYPYGNHHRVIYHKVPCANCGLSTCIENRKQCITSITVDEVMDMVRLQLQQTGSRQQAAQLRVMPAGADR